MWDADDLDVYGSWVQGCMQHAAGSTAMKRWPFNLQSLSAQMILSSIALVLLMAAAAGLPAIWLIRGQFDRQAWAQVNQGSRAAQALYEAKQSELAGLATLTAQRPTLQDLLAQGDQAELNAYLGTLREGSGLDLVAVCSADQQPIAQSGEAILEVQCQTGTQSGFYLSSNGPSPQTWLLATHPVVEEDLGVVMVGLALDDEFAETMEAQTGLGHTLLVDGQPVATSLPARWSLPPIPPGDLPQSTFDLNGQPYFAARLPLEGTDLEAEVALEVTDISATQRGLVWTLAASILAVAVVASLLGTYLARRIGQPLAHLAEAADALSNGDLDTPLAVKAHVREVALVAQALEGARADLANTLVQLRQEKAWTDHLLDAIVEGIVTLDRQGHITFFSNGAERITGWLRSEVRGRSCDEVFKPLEADEPFSQLIPPPGQRRKISIELRDRRQAILAITGARLLPPEGDDARVALVFRDISEEEAIHRLLGHFLANVAHEFRTPLSALAASVELLLDQAPDLNASELGELLTSLHLGVLGLQTLTDNLLESASIETGHFRVYPRACNLGDIIGDAVGMMQPLLEKHGQTLVVELPAAIPVVRADPRRTVQVLINLLSNASKYGPDDAEIEIRAAMHGDWARVSVADAGPGVPPEHREELFRRFVHPGLGSEKAQVGVGLGLSVVKAIAEAQGGEIGMESRPGGGSVFWFTIPRAKEK
jgi:PAS domain S-box-containing protein